MRFFKSLALTTFFFFLFSPLNYLYAECVGGFAVWPESDEIPSSPVILLEGYMNMKATVLNIGQKHRLYLENANGKQVDLNVQQKREPGFQFAQVLLKPAESLKAGDTYTLKIEGLSEADNRLFIFPNKKDGTFGVKKWNVTQKEQSKGMFNVRPSFKETTCRNRSGSEEIFALFNINISQDDLLEAEIFETKNKKVKTYFYIPPNSSNTIRIGKGMCYGTFDLTNGKKYKVKFKTMNAIGEAGSVSPYIKFKTSCTNQ